VLVLFFAMSGVLGSGLLQVGWIILFGWLGFISDVLPRISWNWEAIISVAVFGGILAFLAHSFLAWLGRGIAATRSSPFQWQWKWTCSAICLMGLCFLVGMAVTGTVHQIGWIMSSDQSLLEDNMGKWRQYSEIRNVSMTIDQALSPTNNLSAVREEVNGTLELMGTDYRQIFEQLHVLPLVNSSNAVVGVLVFSRDKQVQKRFGAEFVTGAKDQHLSAEELADFIRSNATNLVAF
jgi:hypothetical protein